MSSPKTMPCGNQTPDEVEAWLQENVQIGTTVAIRHTQAGLCQYVTATVTRIGKGRFEADTLGSGNISTAGQTRYFSGKTSGIPKVKPAW